MGFKNVCGCVQVDDDSEDDGGESDSGGEEESSDEEVSSSDSGSGSNTTSASSVSLDRRPVQKRTQKKKNGPKPGFGWEKVDDKAGNTFDDQVAKLPAKRTRSSTNFFAQQEPAQKKLAVENVGDETGEVRDPVVSTEMRFTTEVFIRHLTTSPPDFMVSESMTHWRRYTALGMGESTFSTDNWGSNDYFQVRNVGCFLFLISVVICYCNYNCCCACFVGWNDGAG